LESGTTQEALGHLKKVLQLIKGEAAIHLQKAAVKDRAVAAGKLPPIPLDVSPASQLGYDAVNEHIKAQGALGGVCGPAGIPEGSDWLMPALSFFDVARNVRS
jgi:hypothetical protein